MKRWYWYVARENELMIDLDARPLLEIALKRIARDFHYPTDGIFVAPSSAHEHFHLVIRLVDPMDTMRRMAYQLYFMDHVYRSAKNIFRVLDSVPAPSLLISPYKWAYCQPWRKGLSSRFWRRPDATCTCKQERHKQPNEIIICPAHVKLRGVAE